MIKESKIKKIQQAIMQEFSGERNLAIERISKIIGDLFLSNRLYQQRLNKEDMIQHLIQVLDKFSPEVLKAISDEELVHRIDSILVVEAVSGTLNDLTPEQIEMFDSSVNRR
ncbi:hypothetical protein [Anabaena sp. CA = ATCC 33047]|uniref:hypothetical protein n=1 Tax=Anabaena sp. (strain CA / ATCC 33047) TaxID=52271 RepID=UPI001E3B0087|nr:hypothetical protein [Anabaena sp. CA = ATCC 33047]